MQFIFLGPPGAGKGTQANVFADRWQIPHISTGEILRQAIAGKTSLGIQAQDYVTAGELVPDTLIMAMVRERFGKPDIKQGWILDGFPRTVAQAQALDELLLIVRQSHPQVLYLEVPTENLVTRLLARGRHDDSEATIRLRLDVYQSNTAALIDLYRKRNRLITINGDQPSGAVTQTLEAALLQSQYSSLEPLAASDSSQ
ncbi:MAG: adenylate kinase [Cyanobacteria bacterium P01_F01_bin.42]